MRDVADLVGRVLLAVLFVGAGINKLGAGYAGTEAYMNSMGVAGWLLPLVIILELGGGLALVLGVLTRLASLGLAVFCVSSAVIFHGNFDDQMQTILFMKNFAIAGGLLVLVANGAGTFSIDGWWASRRAS